MGDCIKLPSIADIFSRGFTFIFMESIDFNIPINHLVIRIVQLSTATAESTTTRTRQTHCKASSVWSINLGKC